jgi:serine/threonine protein phosphatase PrpC
MTALGTMKIASAGQTHPGRIRSENQDAFLERPDLGLWVVADGVGGHFNGAYASGLIVESLAEIGASGNGSDLLGEVTRRLVEVNRRLIEAADAEGGEVTIASTVVALLLRSDRFDCAWAGDSRLYICRDGALKQVSRDHSRVQEMVDDGVLTEAEAVNHPAGNAITRAVGGADTIDIETAQYLWKPGDTFLLCSDGLTKTMSDGEIADILAGGQVGDSVRLLIDGALARGAPDNVTVVVVRPEG